VKVAKLIIVWGALVAAVALFVSCPPPGATTYTVTYDGNGFTSGSAPTDSNNYLQGATVIEQGSGTLVRTGHVFSSWNTAANGSGTSYAAGATFTMGSANVTLYALWTQNPTYTVNYNSNGATGGSVPTDSNNYLSGATVTVLGNTGSLVKTSYNFVGWNTQANGGGTSYSGGATFPMGSANVTLYALWTQNPTYTVTYNSNGATSGTVPTDGNNYQQGVTVTVPGNTGNLVKAGYAVTSWNTQANGSAITYLVGATFLMGSSNVTLYAIWTPTYTVAYNANGSTGGSVPTDSNNYLSGATVTVLGNAGSLVRSAYTFTGWNTQANGSGTTHAGGATFPMGAANVTLYALWTQNPTYTVTYNGNGFTGGSIPADSNNYLQSATVTVLGNTGNLTKIGFAFATWNTQANGGGTSYSGGATFPMGSANVTLYGIWTPTYTVTYDGNGFTGGSVPPDSNNYLQAATVTVLGNTGTLVRTGFTFTNWNTQSNGGGTTYTQGQTFLMGTANVTLYAIWTPTYNVTYNGNGSTGGSAPTDSNNYLQGATVTVLGNMGSLLSAGHTFAGWNTAVDGSGATYSAGYTFSMPASDVTLYAVWNKQVNGGTTINPPPNYSVTINGLTTLHYGSQANFASTYTGATSSYAWYMDTSTTAISTGSSLAITPTVSTYTYGAHVLTLVITDANGLSYAGSLTISVQN